MDRYTGVDKTAAGFEFESALHDLKGGRISDGATDPIERTLGHVQAVGVLAEGPMLGKVLLYGHAKFSEPVGGVTPVR